MLFCCYNIRKKEFISATNTNKFTVWNLYKVLSVVATDELWNSTELNHRLIVWWTWEFSIKDWIIETYDEYVKLEVSWNFGFRAFVNSSADLNSDLPIPFILEGVLFDFAMSYAIVKYIDTWYTLSQTFVSRATSILERVAAKLSSEVVLKSISIKSK